MFRILSSSVGYQKIKFLVLNILYGNWKGSEQVDAEVFAPFRRNCQSIEVRDLEPVYPFSGRVD